MNSLVTHTNKNNGDAVLSEISKPEKRKDYQDRKTELNARKKLLRQLSKKKGVETNIEKPQNIIFELRSIQLTNTSQSQLTEIEKHKKNNNSSFSIEKYNEQVYQQANTRDLQRFFTFPDGRKIAKTKCGCNPKRDFYDWCLDICPYFTYWREKQRKTLEESTPRDSLTMRKPLNTGQYNYVPSR